MNTGERGGTRAGGRRRSGLADQSLHHLVALEVTNPEAVQRFTLLHTCKTRRGESERGGGLEAPCVNGPLPRTQDPVSALQLVGVFAAAQVVDEAAELVDALQALRHDHLLVDQVGPRQVDAGLDATNTMKKS